MSQILDDLSLGGPGVLAVFPFRTSEWRSLGREVYLW
jgi:hypothetical protein